MGTGPKAAAARASLGLTSSSRVLVINTEGATDPVNYQKQLKMPNIPAAEDDFDLAPPLNHLSDVVPPTPSTCQALQAGATKEGASPLENSAWPSTTSTVLAAVVVVGIAALVATRGRR